MSAAWKPGVSFTIHGVTIELQNVVARPRSWSGRRSCRSRSRRRSTGAANGFSWGPIKEVAKLFAGIFICHHPGARHAARRARGRLRAAGRPGHATRTAAPNNAAYFWLTGGLSSFLDNAPTYLVFFELAGGDPQHLMTAGALTLAAISSGAVFMGANTYIGNAPNFMVYAIARERRRQDAELLRLHAVVGRGADPGVHPGDVRVLPLRGAPADGAAYGLGLTARVQHPLRLLRAVSLLFPGFRGDPAGRRAAGRRRTAIRKRT